MRRMCCKGCAAKFKMHSEDVNMGWRHRMVFVSALKPDNHGISLNGEFKAVDSLVCDDCSDDIKSGDVAACITMWQNGREIGEWEHEYGRILSDQQVGVLEGLRK